MRLIVSTPTTLVADMEGIAHVRAEDRTGAFGIRPGHAAFVTILPVSVVTWTDGAGREGFVLVRRGVLTVRDGQRVEIAARGAWSESDLQALGPEALGALQAAEETEELGRTSDARLLYATMRQIRRTLSSARGAASAPPILRPAAAAEART